MSCHSIGISDSMWTAADDHTRKTLHEKNSAPFIVDGDIMQELVEKKSGVASDCDGSVYVCVL